MTIDGGDSTASGRDEWLGKAILEAAKNAGIVVIPTPAGERGTAASTAGSVLTFLSDPAEQRLAFESLRRSEERFRSVVESIPEAIFITEGTRVTYANPAFIQLFGVDPRAVPSLDLLGIVDPNDAARVRETMTALLPGESAHGEYRMLASDGRGLILEISAIAADIDDKPAVLWLGHDVTQRKQLEGQLLQADRLAVLGTLAAGMAHAINNPLSYTLLNLEHVSRRLRDFKGGRDYHSEARVRLAEAHDGAERVAKVVRQMRSLSRVKASAPGPVDVRAVVDSVLAMVGNEIRYRGQLTTRCEPAPRVWAREGELEQAFLGLLLYVARGLPEQTGVAREIGVATGSDDEGNAIVVVRDDGPPISPEAMGRLFDPFSGGEALGLGLAMCQAVIASLEGRLAVETGDRGTTFRVVLPPADSAHLVESRRPQSIAAMEPATPTLPRARVLVIDDDPGVASTLRAMLEAHHEVTSVASAPEGLRLLLSDADFDVVFCDLVMPEISGMDLYCSLELNRPERTPRIVFMTGGVFTPEAERFLARIQNPRIEKPFSLARVEQLLASAVVGRQKTT